jgi:hypothetical protein
MTNFIKTQKGIQIYGVNGFRDGTIIPYDYDPNYDTETSPELKQIALQILQRVTSGSKTDAVDNMDLKGDTYLGSGWNSLNNKMSWFSKSEPPSFYNRKQRYVIPTMKITIKKANGTKIRSNKRKKK